jgi:5-methylcytosine-specific restriction endonuclease McrA
MPFHKERYPSNWKQISKRIRERAGNRCEWCGSENYKPHPLTGSKVILTVAHLNHTPMDCRDENLKALCQRCHLNYDREHHLKNAAETRYRRKLERGQLELLPSV